MQRIERLLRKTSATSSYKIARYSFTRRPKRFSAHDDLQQTEYAEAMLELATTRLLTFLPNLVTAAKWPFQIWDCAGKRLVRNGDQIEEDLVQTKELEMIQSFARALQVMRCLLPPALAKSGFAESSRA